MKKKTCALIISICFFMTNVGGQFVCAYVDLSGAAEAIKAAEPFIPFSAGKISCVKNFNTKDIIINIQDLHCHGETQKNIADILKSLEKYGFNEIYLEGAVGEVSTEKFIKLRDSGLGKLVIEDLVSDGILSGAEYYSIKTGKQNIIKPLDKSFPYFENIILLGNILENRETMRAATAGLRADIEEVKKEYYGSDLLKLDKLNASFAGGGISAKKYYSALDKLAAKAGIVVGAYANIRKYADLANEKSINYRHVSNELKIFADVLKRNIPYGVYRELSRKSNDFSNMDELMPVFAVLSEKYGICAGYGLKNLDALFRHIRTKEEINLIDFVEEENRLTYDIGISLSRTNYEREVVFLDRFAKILEGFFAAKITSGEYGYYLANNDRFQKTVSKYLGSENRHLSLLRGNMNTYEKYHANNILRDGNFLSLLPFSNEPLQGGLAGNGFCELDGILSCLDKGAGVKIVITGGFHSEGLKRRLLENRISFVIITPNVTGETEKAEKAYYDAISRYYRIFTSAINKMPASADPLQATLPKIVSSAINRARIERIPVKEAQNLINRVFSEAESVKSIADAVSAYEPVTGAAVRIDSVDDDKAYFTIDYDYVNGRHYMSYIYDFKTKEVFLTVDGKTAGNTYSSFYYEGKEGFSAPGLLVRYGEVLAPHASALFKDLNAEAEDTLSLMGPDRLHSIIVTRDSVFAGKSSPMRKGLLEPVGDKELAAAKAMIGRKFFEGAPFKAKLTGNFKLMPGGFLIYRIDNPAILEFFSAIRADAKNGTFWSSPESVDITLGMLIPGRYTQKNINKINAVLEAYNKKNPFASVDFFFEEACFGNFSATGNRNVNTETIRFNNDKSKEAAIYLQDVIPVLIASKIGQTSPEGHSRFALQKILNGMFGDSAFFKGMESRTGGIEKIEAVLNSLESGSADFTVKYFDENKDYTEIKYRYEFAGEKLFRVIDEEKVAASIEKFFRYDGGVLREKLSEPVIAVNNKSIAGRLHGIYEELRALLPEEKAFFRRPEFYHFAFSANRSAFPEGSTEITLDYKMDRNALKKIEESIPSQVYRSLSAIKGKLEGYFFMAPDGTISYKLTNSELIRAFNEARALLDADEWRSPTDVHFSLGRLFPGKNTQEDVDRINAALDKYNADNPLKDIAYVFDNVLFGQFTGTGNGFVNVRQINPRAKTAIAAELSYFDNATRLTEIDYKGRHLSDDERFFEAANVEDMLKAIKQLSSFGLSRYEFTFDVLLPDYYKGKTKREIDAFKRKLISSDELYKGIKNIRDYLLKNAETIRREAAKHNIEISMHSFSLTSYAKDKNGKDVPVNPHPGFNREMREIFDWQLEIAEALGAQNITVHLEDHDTDGYAEFVKKAAAKKIRVNFENHLRHYDNDTLAPDAFYFHTLLEGFMDKETFVKTMLEIKGKLSAQQREYLGVTFDTSKALNSYLKTLPLDAGFADINREFSKVTLDNLISYYEAIVNAGLAVNNIHLAQLSANIDNIKKRGPHPQDMRLVIYNKSNIDDLINPSLDMLEFLRYLRRNGYKGALHQETDGIVSPAGADMRSSGGFIGHFFAPMIYDVKTDDAEPDKASFSVNLLSEESSLEITVNGKFVEMRGTLQSVIRELAGRGKDRKFKRVMRDALKALDGKAARNIKFFEMEEAYTSDGGFKEDLSAEIGGFSSNNFNYRREGIIALRKELLENGIALFHEFMHWALAEGAVSVEDVEEAVSDEKIREKFIAKEFFDEEKTRAEILARKGNNYETEISGFGFVDAVELDVLAAKEHYASERAHNAIRAFQAQFFADADFALTSLIRNSSRQYKEVLDAENLAALLRARKKLLSGLVDALALLAAKKEKEEISNADEELKPSDKREADIGGKKPKKAKRLPVKKKAVKLHDQTNVYGTAKLMDEKTIVFDKDVLSGLQYAPGEKVYITSFPGGNIILSVQPEALRSFAGRFFKRPGYGSDELSERLGKLYPGKKIYPETMEAVIDAKGVLRIKLSKNEINTFIRSIGNETDFAVIGAAHGIVSITGKKSRIAQILKEHDNTLQLLEEGVRIVKEIIRAVDSDISFTRDRMNIALAFLNKERTHITPVLIPELELMVKESGLNGSQKSFVLLLLAAISASQRPDIEYMKAQIKNAGAINTGALIMWLDMISNPSSREFFAAITDYLQSRAVIGGCSEAFSRILGVLTVFEEMKIALAVSENEKWMLEAERRISPGRRILYGKYFVEAEPFEDNIDFEKLAVLKKFGIKPLAVSFAADRALGKRDILCYVNTETQGRTVTLEASLSVAGGIPVILLFPLNFESSADYKELYAKAVSGVLNALKDDYTVKGKFAYITRDISLAARIINFLSNESLFRMAGKAYEFDLKAFSFDGSELAELENAFTDLFPEAAYIGKTSAGETEISGEVSYYDISSNISKTKEFIVKVLKRLVLKNKQSESRAGIIIGEKINSKAFSVLAGGVSALAAYGINGLSSYFDARMKNSDSSIVLLEDFNGKDTPMQADAALIDWTSVRSAKKALAGGVLTEEDIRSGGGDMEAARIKSLETAGKVMSVIDAETKAAFDEFVGSNAHLRALGGAERFAQFVLISQLRENLKRIHDGNGKAVLALNISDSAGRDTIMQSALFWQSVGFDGIRLNVGANTVSAEFSVLNALSARMRKEKSDAIIIAGVPVSLNDAAVKTFISKAAKLDIISALEVSRLNDSLCEYKHKIWADISPFNEEYGAGAAKYFEDIQKAVAFGAGYLGIDLGANIISADGKSRHIEIMSRITGMLSLNKTVTAEQAYMQGYRTGLRDSRELKTGDDTLKLIAEELIKLQEGKTLRSGAEIGEAAAAKFAEFLRAEPGIFKLSFIKGALAENNARGIYSAAGYLRGMLEERLLSQYRQKNGFDDGVQSEILRSLLLLDFSMPGEISAYGEDDFIKNISADLSDLSELSPDEMLGKMLEDNYGGTAAAGFMRYALYIYMLKNNGTAISEIISGVNELMKAHLSLINSGYGMPAGAQSRSIDEKWALGQIIEILALSEQKPKIDKSVENAVNGSVNALAVSMMLKAA